MITRRHALKTTAITGAALVLGASPSVLAAETQAEVFKLPPLGYDYDALEPFISAEIMKLHHTKHHAAYVAKLNAAVASSPGLEKKSLEQMLAKLDDVPEAVRKDVRNHGGGHANHSLFWETMKKSPNAKPVGELNTAITAAFGSFERWQEKFSDSAMKVFGSGWAWLVVRDGKLVVENTSNQDSPISNGGTPLLGIDVWEHAYYLQYKSARVEYVKAFQNVIHWDLLSDRFSKLLKK